MKDIFDECQFGEFTLNSRIVRTGLWESQKEKPGNLKPEVFLRYERIAKSGVGLINTELMSLYPHDRFSDYSHNVNYPQFIKEFQFLTETVHNYDVPIFAQLAFVNCNVNGKQNIDVNDLTIEDIRQVQSDYIVAARNINFANFDGIHMNLGNNYYFSDVISPKDNRRKDNYGGNAVNRVRMILEIIQAIKKITDLHVSCRVNVYPDSQEDTLEICRLLEKYGADSIQVTKPFSPKYFTKDSKNRDVLFDFTDRLSKELDIPVILGGGLSDMENINDIINKTDIEFVSMQRPFVHNPTFLGQWKENGYGESECRTCNNCYLKKTSTCHIQAED